MLTITRRDIDDAYSAASAAHRHVQGLRGKGESVMGQVIQTVEVQAGALAIGVACGRYGALHLKGSSVPLDMAAGVALHGAAFFGLFGRHGEHAHNLADGVLAAYTTKVGIGIGTKMRADKGLPPAMTVSGSDGLSAPHWQAPQFGAGGGTDKMGSNGLNVGEDPLTEAELASLANQFR